MAPKRNTNAASSLNAAPPAHCNDEAPSRHPRRNVAYERSLSFSSAPDVLNVNQNPEPEPNPTHSRNLDDAAAANVSNININRQESSSNSLRNLNIINPIPEIIQSHSNNLNTPANSKKKSSSKLPAKNSTNRRNYTLEYAQTANINIASTSETPNPNLASTSREVQDKATSKLFDLLRENVYSEVTALIGVNESHPDFLIQLFRELQLISSDTLRQKVLQSIRNVLSQYSSAVENHSTENEQEDSRAEAVSTTTTMGEASNFNDPMQNASSSNALDNEIIRFMLSKGDEICTSEFLETLALTYVNTTLMLADNEEIRKAKKKLVDYLSKYEGMRICDVTTDMIENWHVFMSALIAATTDNDSAQIANDLPESSIMQDVAGSLNLFSSSDSQLHQMNACPYDMWPGHVHMDIDAADLNENSARSSQDGKVDLINCSEMHNGDLAEADQTCHTEADEAGARDEASNAEALPDVVDTDEVTPTEAEAEWLGLDRVPTRLHMEESSEKQKD